MKYFLTSINNAYIPKALALAESIKRIYGDAAHITCMLSDTKRDDVDYSLFDDVLTIDQLDLPVPSLEAWIFKHTVVELCTAVKPWAFKKIFERYTPDAVVYMDPDTILYSPMDEIYATLPAHPVILTPHVSVPAVDQDDLLDGEMLGCLRHGVFNLGFLALGAHGEGKDFLDWWAARCLDWCYDDGPKGLFTDQRWVDLAPCFFPTLHVLRHVGYNTATWNLYYRSLSRNADGDIVVNGDQPLRFFHFSGFDIGTHELMLQKHAPDDKLLHEMSDWYIEQQKRHGQKRLGKRPGVYDSFSDGTPINVHTRIAYRESETLPQKFPTPYGDPAFQLWVDQNATQIAPAETNHLPVGTTMVRRAVNRIKRYPKLAQRLERALPARLRLLIRRRM